MSKPHYRGRMLFHCRLMQYAGEWRTIKEIHTLAGQLSGFDADAKKRHRRFMDWMHLGLVENKPKPGTKNPRGAKLWRLTQKGREYLEGRGLPLLEPPEPVPEPEPEPEFQYKIAILEEED